MGEGVATDYSNFFDLQLGMRVQRLKKLTISATFALDQTTLLPIAQLPAAFKVPCNLLRPRAPYLCLNLVRHRKIALRSERASATRI